LNRGTAESEAGFIRFGRRLKPMRMCFADFHYGIEHICAKVGERRDPAVLGHRSRSGLPGVLLRCPTPTALADALWVRFQGRILSSRRSGSAATRMRTSPRQAAVRYRPPPPRRKAEQARQTRGQKIGSRRHNFVANETDWAIIPRYSRLNALSGSLPVINGVRLWSME